MKIHLVMLGKTRIPEIRALLEDYIRRIEHFAEVQVTELRDAMAWRKQKLDSHAAIVALDAAGKQFTSQQFAKWLGAQRDSGLRELMMLGKIYYEAGREDGKPAARNIIVVDAPASGNTSLSEPTDMNLRSLIATAVALGAMRLSVLNRPRCRMTCGFAPRLFMVRPHSGRSLSLSE